MAGSAKFSPPANDVKGLVMSHLFVTGHKPKWILLIAGNDSQLRHEQADELKRHSQELRDRSIIVVEVSPTEAVALHGDCRCVASAGDIADSYKLSFDRFSSSLVDENDCVKWAAPAPVCFSDLIAVIDEMPHHEAENATRGPALSARPVVSL